MKHLISITIALVVAAMPVAARQYSTINDGWTYTAAGQAAGQQVHLPHTWNTDAYTTRHYRRGAARYTRPLHIDSAWQGRNIYIVVDGAATQSAVSIDGREAGTHVGAYSPHTVDITPYVHPGSTHMLEIDVDNSSPDVPPHSADFTFMGGLYRDVHLVVAEPLHLDFSDNREGFRASASLLPDGTTGTLAVGGTVRGVAEARGKVKVQATLSDASGAVVASRTVRPARNGEFTLDFGTLENISPWSPDAPALYSLRVAVADGARTTDSATCAVGFRTFGFDDQGRFLVNGTPVKLRGMCRHQDARPCGIALTDEMHRRDMQLIKDLGANFVRISHYPQDDAVLEMADRLGLIVWEEIPVIDYVPDTPDFARNSEAMLREMIRSHRNHPSVAMWGYMNEILLRRPPVELDACTQRALALARRLEEVVREEDPTRLSTMAFHGSDVYHDAGLADITDVKGWNLYQGWYGGDMGGFEKHMSRQHREHPAHRLIVSEYGAGSDLRLHSLRPEAFDFSTEYQQAYLEHYLPVIEDSTFIAGASHWNFVDFSSANRAESMPHINNKGLATADRRLKDVYHYYRAAWHDASAGDTVAHIALRDWPVRTDIEESPGAITRPVKVYTNLPAVALRVNGSLLPAQQVRNCTVVFDAPLRHGVNIVELISPEAPEHVLDACTAAVNLLPLDADGRLDLGTAELAVNVGSGCYFRSDVSGLTWLPDREYAPGSVYGHIGGRPAVTQDEIACTPDTPLLQRSLSGLESFRARVVPGTYEVELSFAELTAPSEQTAYLLGHNAGSGDSGAARMNIDINGSRVEQAFAPALIAGEKTMVRRRYTATAGLDGVLSIDFTPAGGATSLSAVKIRKL